jgi:hypothetical protein
MVFLAGFGGSRIALIWGTPMPEMMRVVQIEPGPMPTLTASAPGFHQIAGTFISRDVAGDDVGMRERLLQQF